MPRWRALLASATVLVAVASGGAATHAAAPPEPRSVQTLILGTALPDTGSLKAYGPATQAAVRLAVDDANAAGGVLGSPVELVPGDSGGVGSTTFARTLTRLGAVDAIIGPLSSQLVLDNIGAVTGHTLVSPAATSPQLSGVLARTVQAEPLAGAMLATLAKQRGAVRLVVVGPRDQRPLMDAALDRGRDIGLQVSSVLHTPTQSAATIASKVVRSSADAILLASREQATSILRELLVRGLPATVLLSPGAATSIVSRDLRRGTLDGALTVELDLRVPRELAKRVRAIAPTAPETEYSPQAYDAAAITILAAEQSGRVFGEISPEGIGAALPAVTSVGTACETLATCLRLLRQGADIDYVGYVGPYELDLKGDPRAARYLVRVFTDANKPGSSARPVRYP